MRVFLLFVCALALVSASCSDINLFQWLREHEGVRKCVSTAPCAQDINVSKTDAEMNTLMQKDLELNFYGCARSAVSNYASLPQAVRTVIVDMTFNLGCAGFKSFTNTIKAFERRDFAAAANGMQNSRWCGQVGRRCTRNVNVVKGCIGH
ncbi:hypothetical protein GEMRC1_010900 [Eukaryota sp. GEM-RC1]